MNRTAVFAKRNITEIMRSPVSWAFGLLLPLGIFVIMQIIMNSIKGAAATVPMFDVDRFTGGVVIFGASFFSMFAAMLISNDRKQSFLSRLFASPMKARDFILGYALGVLPLALAGSVITFAAAMCFGVTLSANILAAVSFSVVIDMLFVAIGIIMGSLLSDKNAPPLCSVVVQLTALLSGMWFDLDMIGGGFNVFCHVLPFAHCYDIIRYTIAGDYANVWLPVLVTAGYTVALTVAAVFAFRRSSKRV